MKRKDVGSEDDHRHRTHAIGKPRMSLLRFLNEGTESAEVTNNSSKKKTTTKNTGFFNND